MFRIEKDKDGNLLLLSLTKSDSAYFVVEVFNPSDNTPYDFKQGDSIKLLVKKFYSDQNSLVELIGTPKISTNVALFQVSGNITMNLPIDRYIMQIVLTLVDGTKHTIVSPCFDKYHKPINNLNICGSLNESEFGTKPSGDIDYYTTNESNNSVLKGILNYNTSSILNVTDIQHNTLKGLSYLESGHIGFQPQTDPNLQTLDKTTTGAINEIYNTVKTAPLKFVNGGNPDSIGLYKIDGGNPDSVPIYHVDGGNII